MTGHLTPGSLRSRLAALALLAAVIAPVWLFLIGPALSARDALEAELTTSQNLRARLRAQASAQLTSGTGALIYAPTSPIAAAKLQSDLEFMVADSGATADTLEAVILPTDRVMDGGMKPVVIAVAMTATTAQLRRILLAIDDARTVMIVEELSVRTENAAAGLDSGAAADRLRVEMRVRAFSAQGRAG